MAVQPGNPIDPGAINMIAQRLTQKGEAQGIPGLGNVGDQSADGWRRILTSVFSKRQQDLRGKTMLAWLTRHGYYAQAHNPTGGNLPAAGPPGQAGGVNTLSPTGIPTQQRPPFPY